MNERAILIILSKLSEYPEYPYDNSWPNHEKEEITFSHWALTEILDLVSEHPLILASDTIENFAIRLQFYAKTSKTSEQKRIFSIAAETALEFLEEVKLIEK